MCFLQVFYGVLFDFIEAHLVVGSFKDIFELCFQKMCKYTS